MSLCFNNDCFNEECDVFEIKAAGDIRGFFLNDDWIAYLKLKPWGFHISKAFL